MKILLTGITGLVGAGFVAELLRERKDISVVAVCRDGRGQQASDRIRQTLQEQCDFDGCGELAAELMQRITPVSGNVADLPVDELKAKGPFDAFFHCAADVNLGKDPDGRTFETNFRGTENAIRLAKELSIPAFHYVSTAYVAGTFSGLVKEDELPAQGFNNSYERSKFEAEKLVRTCGIPFSIYRPSIVVGRLSDGRIRKPLAFYRILEFLGKVKKHRCKKHGLSPSAPVEMPMRLESEISDKIYFVPLDFVQKSIAKLFQLPPAGRAYHITGESPVSTKDIEVAVSAVLKVKGLTVMKKVPSPSMDEKLVQRMIGDLMPYFASEIVFDNSNIKAALGEDALAWRIGEPFLERMAEAFYRHGIPELTA